MGSIKCYDPTAIVEVSELRQERFKKFPITLRKRRYLEENLNCCEWITKQQREALKVLIFEYHQVFSEHENDLKPRMRQILVSNFIEILKIA